MTFHEMPFDAADKNKIVGWLNDRAARMTEPVWHLLSFISYIDAEGRDRSVNAKWWKRVSLKRSGSWEQRNDLSQDP